MLGEVEVRELHAELRRGRGSCLVVEARPSPLAPSGPPAPGVALRHRATGDLRHLPYAALAELCEPVLDHLGALPEVQARALAGAIALEPPDGGSLAVAAGFRNLLRAAAAQSPLTAVVEHAHLLDRPSASALAFVAARAHELPAGVVVTQESGHDAALVLPAARRATSGATAGVAHPSSRAVRLLGGLRVERDGRAAALPAGAVSRVVAFVALRRACHIEEATEVLWPEVGPDVARRRLRNVLTRARQAAGELVLRHGDRLELAPGVLVDQAEALAGAMRALAAPSGLERRRMLVEAIDVMAPPLLPGLAYEDWVQEERDRLGAMRAELEAALLAESSPV